MATEIEKNLLVIDDEEDARDLIRFVLEPHGYRVHMAGDGNEALDLLRNERIAVAIVDILMPGMSGPRFLEKLGVFPEERRPVTIVLSARRNEELERDLAGLEVFDVIAKPFELPDIVDYVNRAFEEKLRRSA